MTGTFGAARARWIDQLGSVRNVVRQELIGRQLDRHLPSAPSTVLDVGAGQGTQSLRLARAGHVVTAVEPDATMRAALLAGAHGEPVEVQARLVVHDSSVEAIAEVPGTFDAVLLLGVAMYLAEPMQAVRDVAAKVVPGGVLALAVRTTTSALWRPAARQDWFAAQAAIAEYGQARAQGRDMAYTNEIGSAARAQEFDALTTACAAESLELERWYGVRIAVDLDEVDPPAPSDPAELAALLEVEDHLASIDPFRQLGQLAHLVFRRPA